MWPFRSKQPNRPPAPQKRALSFLPPEQVGEFGQLPDEAIVGFFLGPEGHDNFEPNPVFVGLMHEAIQRIMPRSEEMRRDAAEQGDGWIYIIDARTPEGPNGRVPPEDIIGGFEAKDGSLSGNYWANAEHLLWSINGMVRLHDTVLQDLTKTVRDRSSGAARN